MQSIVQIQIDVMKNSIASILGSKVVAIYIYGSVVLNDFKPGWSDIDMLCLTDGSLTEQEKNLCLTLRQTLMNSENDDTYRLFEGAIVSLDDFITGRYSGVVYWGTHGQRITDTYCCDVFSLYELQTYGLLVFGTDIRRRLTCPTYDELRTGVINHYRTIRKYALTTDDSLYSCGWLLDISRCLYTLHTGLVIAKTKSGEWALKEKLCPVCDSLEKTLKIRNNPTVYKHDKAVKGWLCTLGPQVQKYADVLEYEIERTKQ